MKISISAPYKCPRDVIYCPEIPFHFGKCLSDLKFCTSAGYFDKNVHKWLCRGASRVESSGAVPWWITILLPRKKYPIWRNFAPPNLKCWAKRTTNKRWILGASSPESHWICPSFWGPRLKCPRCWKNQGEGKKK